MNLPNTKPCKPPINFYWEFAEVTDGLKGGLFLSKAYELSLENHENHGWFSMGCWDWHDIMLLTPNEVKTIRKKLRSIGVLEEAKVGFPPKVHFRVNISNLRELVSHRSFARLPYDQ
jgi:hypothetical protein